MPNEQEPKRGALARAELRRLAGLPARARLSALIDSPEAKRLVRSSPAEELYAAVAEVGLADSTEIVQLASPAQFRTFVDLGGWRRDRMDPHEVLTWLRAARGDEPEDFLAKLHALDLEVLELLLRTFTAIHDREENPNVHPEGVTIETPEGKYLVEINAEGPELAAVRALVNDLLAEGPFEAVRLLEAIRWEIPAEMEEAAYQFRSARLADLGFPEVGEALALYSYVDPSKLAPGGPALEREALARSGERVDYLGVVLAGLAEDERLGLEQELRYVANAALVAEAADPGDIEAIRRVGEQVRDYLALGLEHLTGGEAGRAVEVVREHPLKRVFQVGFSLTLKLKFRADRLAEEPLFKLDDAVLLLPEEEAAVAALQRKRPLRVLKVEGAEPVTFRSRRELAESELMLDRAERQVAIFRALLGGGRATADAALSRFGVKLEVLGMERLLAAIVCNAVLGTPAPQLAAPVPRGRLVELGERLFEGEPRSPRLRPEATRRAREALTPLVEEAAREEVARMVDRALARLLAELGTAYLTAGTLDPITFVVVPLEGQPL